MKTDSNSQKTKTVSTTFGQRGGGDTKTVSTTYKTGSLTRGSQVVESSKKPVSKPIMRTCHF